MLVLSSNELLTIPAPQHQSCKDSDHLFIILLFALFGPGKLLSTSFGSIQKFINLAHPPCIYTLFQQAVYINSFLYHYIAL